MQLFSWWHQWANISAVGTTPTLYEPSGFVILSQKSRKGPKKQLLSVIHDSMTIDLNKSVTSQEQTILILERRKMMYLEKWLGKNINKPPVADSCYCRCLTTLFLCWCVHEADIFDTYISQVNIIEMDLRAVASCSEIRPDPKDEGPPRGVLRRRLALEGKIQVIYWQGEGTWGVECERVCVCGVEVWHFSI